jgi:hypothetical protein
LKGERRIIREENMKKRIRNGRMNQKRFGYYLFSFELWLKMGEKMKKLLFSRERKKMRTTKK